MKRSKYKFHDREISWLSFNARVLQEAEDPSVPLIERLKFLGIFSSNLDEFFRVRVPTVQKMAEYGKKAIPVIGFNPKATLKKIFQTNIKLNKRFDKALEMIKQELKEEGIFFVNEQELTTSQQEHVREYFNETVLPALVPVMLSEQRELPELNGKAIYLAVKLYNLIEGKEEDLRYALVEVPTAVVSRFFVISEKGKRFVILLEDIMRSCMDEVFTIFEFDKVEAYTIKLTRDAELDIEDDITSGFMEKLALSLKNRKKGDPVRFVHDAAMPKDLRSFLIDRIHLEDNDVVVAGGRYHNSKDYIKFPKIGAAHLRYRDLPPLLHPRLESNTSIFKSIREKDVLLSFPYHSYHYVIDLLREAAIDPQVESIKITLYRLVSKNSKIIHTLISAAKNGKKVTVVVELKARFDEESNMNYADKLQDEGIKVIFGAQGLKVHTKLLLIKRREEGAVKRYAHIGTGNFHEGTAHLYCDHSLLTADKSITEEINNVFKFFKNNYRRFNFDHLLVAPFNSRRRFYEMIDREIQNAKQGKPAYIIAKLNNLQDEGIAVELYKASAAGVKVDLIARSINNLMDGMKYSENIRAISIVDRFLEHARILVFGNGGDERYYMGSSDWMTRNLDRRVEVMTPIYDKDLKAELKAILNFQLNDNVKSRIWNAALDNEYVQNGKSALRAQYATYAYYRAILKDHEIAVEAEEEIIEEGITEELMKKVDEIAKLEAGDSHGK